MLSKPQISVEELPIDAHEQRLVREFFELFGRGAGYFVEVGANDPFDRSQTWHLERRGWRGVLIEPQPDFAALLRENRSSRVVNVACSTPENAGRIFTLHIAGHDGALASLNRNRMVPGAVPHAAIDVPVRTLDDVLSEAGAPSPIDFLTVDVEGHELEVLSGLNFERWAPRLILIEDFVSNLKYHRFMLSRGYRLVRRTSMNGWYVPAAMPVSFGLAENLRLLRKYYLALPIRIARDFTRRLRGTVMS